MGSYEAGDGVVPLVGIEVGVIKMGISVGVAVGTVATSVGLGVTGCAEVQAAMTSASKSRLALMRE
ncbi:MAG: hypothetical protein C0401_09880 [Anaerolinea sp.]|nr:hypothetical protein [Anaerolinea sp.]